MLTSPSFYNLSFMIDGRRVLFNTLRGNLVEITEELDRALIDKRISEIPQDLAAQLKDLGFLVQSDYDETAEYLDRYETSKEKGGELWVKLFMATSCNLGCPYCYQSAPAKPGNVIKKEEIDRLLKWFDWECSQNKITGLEVEFYGGEPLLAQLQFPRFMEQINRTVERHSIRVGYSIITNATLLNDSLIDLFVKNRVSMQITLDGDREMHDERRAWKETGRGSFDQIFENLGKICDRGGSDLVKLRMNIDQNNIGQVESVASRAKALGVQSFSCGRIHFREKQTPYAANMIPSSEFDENFDLEIFRILQPLGYASSPSKLDAVDTCLYHWKRGFAVSPSLELFKCDELIDFPEHCVGHIDQDGIPHLKTVEYDRAVSRKPTDFEHCTTCRYLPQCGSGCSIRALNAKGTPHLNFCESTYDSVKRKVKAYILAEEEGLISDTSGSSCGSCHCNA
jgi:uncharacterized protein